MSMKNYHCSAKHAWNKLSIQFDNFLDRLLHSDLWIFHSCLAWYAWALHPLVLILQEFGIKPRRLHWWRDILEMYVYLWSIDGEINHLVGVPSREIWCKGPCSILTNRGGYTLGTNIKVTIMIRNRHVNSVVSMSMCEYTDIVIETPRTTTWTLQVFNFLDTLTSNLEFIRSFGWIKLVNYIPVATSRTTSWLHPPIWNRTGVCMSRTVHYIRVAMSRTVHSIRIAMSRTVHHVPIAMARTVHCIPIVISRTEPYSPIAMSRTVHYIPIVMSRPVHYIPIVMSRTVHHIPIVMSRTVHCIPIAMLRTYLDSLPSCSGRGLYRRSYSPCYWRRIYSTLTVWARGETVSRAISILDSISHGVSLYDEIPDNIKENMSYNYIQCKLVNSELIMQNSC
jgi:hypothetical protein